MHIHSWTPGWENQADTQLLCVCCCPKSICWVKSLSFRLSYYILGYRLADIICPCNLFKINYSNHFFKKRPIWFNYQSSGQYHQRAIMNYGSPCGRAIIFVGRDFEDEWDFDKERCRWSLRGNQRFGHSGHHIWFCLNRLRVCVVKN